MTTTPETPLAGREILLGVSGGIACYKAADLASKLVQAGAGVTVMLTEGAQRFVGVTTFAALTRRRVHTSLWEPADDGGSAHISLTEKADLYVVAPATANIMAKFAMGLADDLLSTAALAAHTACDVLLAPAMNTRMWTAPATVANVATLRERGLHVVGPNAGNLACGTVGAGRMAEPAEILQAVIDLLAAR